jgi:hypothetical protein
MGPGINEIEVSNAYKEIMALLKNKYKVQSHEPLLLKKTHGEQREKVNLKFREALRELFFQQACEDF